VAKPRVHELAKELDPSGKKITSKMILAWLKDQGEFVKAASSAVEPPVARRVREHFASQAASAQGGSSNTNRSALAQTGAGTTAAWMALGAGATGAAMLMARRPPAD